MDDKKSPKKLFLVLDEELSNFKGADEYCFISCSSEVDSFGITGGWIVWFWTDSQLIVLNTGWVWISESSILDSGSDTRISLIRSFIPTSRFLGKEYLPLTILEFILWGLVSENGVKPPTSSHMKIPRLQISVL